MNRILIGTLLIASALLSACTSSPASKSATKPVGIANPASVYCEKIGGSSVSKKDTSGNELGYCKLPDGAVMAEWEHYRSEHHENYQNLIISYDVAKKQNVINEIEAQKMQIIYDLKNMNIIVVSILKSDIQEITKNLEKIDGVLNIQEDSKMELY